MKLLLTPKPFLQDSVLGLLLSLFGNVVGSSFIPVHSCDSVAYSLSYIIQHFEFYVKIKLLYSLDPETFTYYVFLASFPNL